MLRLKAKYREEILPLMKKEFGYKNDLAIPRIKKIVVNTSFGRLAEKESGDKLKRAQQAIALDLTTITGQKPALRRAKKSIAGFHIREGDSIGYVITLRGQRMNDFFEKMVYLALPRTRDFRGIEPSSLDGNGNLTIGFPEQLVFPEISSEEERTVFGLEAVIVTNAKNDKEALKLLSLLGVPFKKENKKDKNGKKVESR